MVFRGQPSLACAACKARRTKCDEKRPSCSQCIRSGRQCTGYRELSDMIFRDESKSVAAKSERIARGKPAHVPPTKASEIRKSSARTGSIEVRRKASLNVATRNCDPKILWPLVRTSAEDQGTCFFFHNYVMDNQARKNRNYQYLSSIYDIKDSSPALADCIAALGLAGLANFWKASSVMAGAHARYNSAIQGVSLMLAGSDTVRSDQTLVAVMLLGMYETNTCSGRQSMKSWTKHINGATTLLQLRGKHQFSTPLGRQIFAYLRTQIVVSSIQQQIEVPDFITKWAKITLPYESPTEAASTNLVSLSIQLAKIRASIPSFQDYSRSASIVNSLSALDAEYVQWASTTPPEFSYITVPLLQPSIEVYGDSYYVYSSLYSAVLWNHYRSMRILINQTIGDQLSHHLQSSSSLETFISADATSEMTMGQLGYQGAAAISSLCLSAITNVRILSQDICASVPFFLNTQPPPPPPPIFSTPSSSSPSPSPSPSSHSHSHSHPPSPLSTSTSSSFSSSNPPAQPPKSICGNLLLWPLYTAACTWMVPDTMREWAAARLLSIADTMGIRQAAPLARALMMSLHIEKLDWKDDVRGNGIGNGNRGMGTGEGTGEGENLVLEYKI